jgi:hypothetical protein|eukprot:COSAG06_NODE_1080_length_10790_cov_7.338228_7_plen_180_part_00
MRLIIHDDAVRGRCIAHGRGADRHRAEQRAGREAFGRSAVRQAHGKRTDVDAVTISISISSSGEGAATGGEDSQSACGVASFFALLDSKRRQHPLLHHHPRSPLLQKSCHTYPKAMPPRPVSHPRYTARRKTHRPQRYPCAGVGIVHLTGMQTHPVKMTERSRIYIPFRACVPACLWKK